MRRSPVAYPTSRFRSLAQTDNENLQTQSPRNPVRLTGSHRATQPTKPRSENLTQPNRSDKQERGSVHASAACVPIEECSDVQNHSSRLLLGVDERQEQQRRTEQCLLPELVLSAVWLSSVVTSASAGSFARARQARTSRDCGSRGGAVVPRARTDSC